MRTLSHVVGLHKLKSALEVAVLCDVTVNPAVSSQIGNIFEASNVKD